MGNIISGDLGKIIMTFKEEEWSPMNTYDRLDVVKYNRQIFVSKIENNKEEPSIDATNWFLMLDGNLLKNILDGEGKNSLIQYNQENPNSATGINSIAFGSSTFSQNNNEVSFGAHNLSTKDKTLLSIGIGTVENKKNALEVSQTGECYILGVGNYDGTNSATANPISTLKEAEVKSIIDEKNKEQ